MPALFEKNSNEFQTIGKVHAHTEPRGGKRWERPEEDVLKINCDGAFRSETSTRGWGFLIRDEAGCDQDRCRELPTPTGCTPC